MASGDADAELKRLAGKPEFRQRDAAQRALRFRAAGDVADLLAVLDDPHPCVMLDVLFAMAGSGRPWLNWVPMPTEAICLSANEIGRRRAQGERVTVTTVVGTSAEPASAVTAFRRVVAAPVKMDVWDFPDPDIRQPVRPGRYAVWQYAGHEPKPAVPAPSDDAVQVLREVADGPWPSPLSGYLQAEPLGRLPLADLLGLLGHLPGPADNVRWRYFATTTPTYWYRLMQPWVCLGILHHATHEPWPSSTRRDVLVDLAFGIEDWVSDAALFALITAAYREADLRDEVRQLVRARLDAAITAERLVSIRESLAQLMLITPGGQADDAARARAVLEKRDGKPGWRRRFRPRLWWRHP